VLALLGPDVGLRLTPYSVEAAVAAYRASGDPLAEQMVEVLQQPPTREEILKKTEGNISGVGELGGRTARQAK
jgi:hypothetical protein